MAIYSTELKKIKIKKFDIELLCVNNIDELFNNLLSEDSNVNDVRDERIPYWAELWPSAIALSEFIIENNVIKKGASVLEVGCGLGLPGIIAGKMGGAVTFTDYMQAPLDFAEKNWRKNNGTVANFTLMDWRQPDHKFASDIVLASDIAYESRSFSSILSALKMLVTPYGKILLSEPNRELAKPFIESLSTQFHVKKINSEIELNKVKTTVNIFELSLPL